MIRALRQPWGVWRRGPIVFVGFAAALSLIGCGEGSDGGAKSGKSNSGVFSRANKQNIGYEAVKGQFDEFYTRCNGSWYTRKTFLRSRRGTVVEKQTIFYQIDDLEFAVIEHEVSPVAQRNGKAFSGLLVFADDALFRTHNPSAPSYARDANNWSQWKTVGVVTESKAEDALRNIAAWDYSGGRIELVDGNWFVSMHAPFIASAETKRGSERILFSKPDCADIPAG